MKKFLSLLLVFTLVFSLAACEVDEKTPDPVDPDPDQTTYLDGNDLNELEKKIKVLHELVISNSPYDGTYEEWVDCVSPPTDLERQVKFTITNDHLKWRYDGENNWNTLVNLLTLLGGVTSIEGYHYDSDDNLIMSFNSGSEANLGEIDFVVKVEFLGLNEILLEEQYIEVGTSAIAPSIPDVTGYEFDSWSVDFSDISNDLIVQANFTETKIQCEENQSLVDGVCIERQETPANKLFSVNDLLEDFDQAVNLLDKYHPKTFADQDIINSLVTSQRRLISKEMTQNGFLRILAPVVTAYNSGHTEIVSSRTLYSYNYQNALFFPLTTRVIDRELYIVEDPVNTGIVLGSKITAINDKKISDLFVEFEQYFSTDGLNKTFIEYKLNEYFRYLYYEWIDQSESFTIEYIEYETGELKNVTVDAVLMEDLPGYSDWNRWNATYNDSYAIMELNSFYASSTGHAGNAGATESDFYDFYESFFKEVEDRNIEHVILDLRDNGGGSLSTTTKLLSYIQSIEQSFYHTECITCDSEYKDLITNSTYHFDGELYTLVGGGSYSQTSLLTSLIKDQNIGVLIGDETPGSYILNDKKQTYRLTNTGALLDVTKSVSYTNVDDTMFVHGEGIQPDFKVHMTIDDYLNGVDTVLEFTIDMIFSGNE